MHIYVFKKEIFDIICHFIYVCTCKIIHFSLLKKYIPWEKNPLFLLWIQNISKIFSFLHIVFSRSDIIHQPVDIIHHCWREYQERDGEDLRIRAISREVNHPTHFVLIGSTRNRVQTFYASVVKGIIHGISRRVVCERCVYLLHSSRVTVWPITGLFSPLRRTIDATPRLGIKDANADDDPRGAD